MRAEYAYDLKSHYGQFFDVCIIAADSVAGQAVGFDALTSFGAQFARLPVSAFVHKPDAPVQPLDHLELWNNFSYSFEAHSYSALKHMRCTVLLRDGKKYHGTYMFTFSWWGSSYAEDPGEGGFKRGHFIRLDNGNFAIQPNNRIKWHDPSFITEPFPAKPDFLTNTHVWNCEQGDRWVTSSDDLMYYDVSDAAGAGDSDESQ
jgi:hypothetical protein